MATVGNNTSAKHEQLREAFFTEGEKEQFKKVMRNPKDQRIHAKMLEEKQKLFIKKQWI